MKYLIIKILILSSIREKCLELVGSIEKCIPLEDCESAKKLVPQARFNAQIRVELQKLLCGFHHNNQAKVCCREFRPTTVQPPTRTTPMIMPLTGSPGVPLESCKTLSGKVGSCVSTADCQPLLRVLPQAKKNPDIREILRKELCNPNVPKPKICCPLLPTDDFIPSKNAQPPLTTVQPQVTTITPTTVTTQNTVKTSASNDFIPAFPIPPVCGSSNGSFGRIVGGLPAKLGDFPWMAALGYQRREEDPIDWRCGGSLISSHHVVTAAHCIHKYKLELVVVRLGELDVDSDDDGAHPVDVLIKDMIENDKYDPKTFDNDIGVLVLEEDVTFTDLIHPICIPVESKMRTNDYVDYNPFVAGWGRITFRGPKSSQLQLVQVPVVSNEFCEQAYDPYKPQYKISSGMLCAGYKEGGKDNCEGDSGGPLMQPVRNRKISKSFFYQIGIASYGGGCADARFPGVYSRVTSFVPWLEKVVLGVESS